MRKIAFNGLGQPNDPSIQSGDVLLLVQDGQIEIVRLELLGPDDFGPCFHHANNNLELASEAEELINTEHPDCLGADIAYTFLCPEDLARKAVF